MSARLNIFAIPSAGKVIKHITSASKVVHDSTLPVTTGNVPDGVYVTG